MRRFTNIDHIARLSMGLLFTEYCICDSIEKLQNHISSVNGYCNVPQQKLADFIGITREQVNRIIKKCVDLGILEKSDGMVKTTAVWDDAHRLDSDIISHKKSDIPSHEPVTFNHNVSDISSQEPVTSHHSHLIVNNNKENNKENNKATVFSFQEFYEKFPTKIHKKKAEEKYKKINEKTRAKIKDTIDVFVSYKPFKTYIPPNAYNYLKDERWNDVLPEQRKNFDKKEFSWDNV